MKPIAHTEVMDDFGTCDFKRFRAYPTGADLEEKDDQTQKTGRVLHPKVCHIIVDSYGHRK